MKSLMLGDGKMVIVNQPRQIKITGCQWLPIISEYLLKEEQRLQGVPWFFGGILVWSKDFM